MEFCTLNSALSRGLLLRTILRSYIRHTELHRYLARVIREIHPLYETLPSEVEKSVRVGVRERGAK